MSTFDQARLAMTAELADAFSSGEDARVHAAASWLRATGTPLVDVYEVLLEVVRADGPEFARTADDHVRRHQVQERLRDLVARLPPTAASSRGDVLVVVVGGSLHVLGVTALVHVLQDAGWAVTAAPELGLDDVVEQLERLEEPVALVLALNDRTLLPRTREVVRRARARFPSLRVLVGGAVGEDVPDLASAVGATTTTTTLRELLAVLDDDGPLSPRELAVLRCVAAGMSNPDTAIELGVAPATVKTHLDRVYAKLGTSDRTATVALAMRRGWIS